MQSIDRLKSQLLRILDSRLERVAAARLRVAILEVRMKLVSMNTDASKEEVYSIISACHELDLGPEGIMKTLFQSWIELV